jgi:hypothetical protein
VKSASIIESVYVDRTHVQIVFADGSKKQSFSLDQFYIRVSETNVETHTNYTYEVSLLHKDNAKIDGTKSYPANKKGGVPVITLARRITRPDNLREYVESFQSQIEPKLDVTFGSEQIALDYEHKTYRYKSPNQARRRGL